MGARPKTNLEDAGLLTVDKAAEGLECSRSKIYRLVKEGKLETRKLGGTVLVTAESMDRLLRLTVSGKAGPPPRGAAA